MCNQIFVHGYCQIKKNNPLSEKSEENFGCWLQECI